MNFLFTSLLSLPAIVLAFTFHEYAHAKVADNLGDKTPRFQGRLTLNPIKHIDFVGMVLILLVGFGWAKPVQTNPSAYKDYYKDDLKVSIAGPLANLMLGVVGCFLYVIVLTVQSKTWFMSSDIAVIVIQILWSIFSINISLFVFNLLPLPGLDGFHVLRDLEPDTFYKIQEKLYRYQNLILLGVLAFGSRIIMIPVEYIMKAILNIASNFLGIFF